MKAFLGNCLSFVQTILSAFSCRVGEVLQRFFPSNVRGQLQLWAQCRFCVLLSEHRVSLSSPGSLTQSLFPFQKRWVAVLSQEYPTLAFHASLTNPFGKGAFIQLLRQFGKVQNNFGDLWLVWGVTVCSLLLCKHLGFRAAVVILSLTARCKRRCYFSPVTLWQEADQRGVHRLPQRWQELSDQYPPVQEGLQCGPHCRGDKGRNIPVLKVQTWLKAESMWNQPNDLVKLCTDLHRLCDPGDGLVDSPCSEALLWQHSQIPTLPHCRECSAALAPCLCSPDPNAGPGSVSLPLLFKSFPRAVWKALMGHCWSLPGVAVHHPHAADFPHRLPRCGLSIRRLRDRHCAEGSGMCLPWVLESFAAVAVMVSEEWLHTCKGSSSAVLFQVQVEKIKSPEDHIGAVLERAKAEYIRKTYKIDSWTDTEDFLEKLAARTGKLLKVWQLPAFAGWKSMWLVLNMGNDNVSVVTGHRRAVCCLCAINCSCFSSGWWAWLADCEQDGSQWLAKGQNPFLCETTKCRTSWTRSPGKNVMLVPALPKYLIFLMVFTAVFPRVPWD